MINFICKNISDGMDPNQPALIIPSQLNSSAGALPKNTNPGGLTCQMRQDVALGLQIFRNLVEKVVHGSSKRQNVSEPIICVNSMLRQNDFVLLQCFVP